MKPRLITQRSLIHEAIRFARQWLTGPHRKFAARDTVERLERQASLDFFTATPDDFREKDVPLPTTRCHGCGENVTLAVEVGEEADYESATAILCIDCVKDALAAFVECQAACRDG